jgi:tetratricopeptide (TPR) repeat protein
MFEETLTRVKSRFGPEHPHTLDCMNHLANGYFSAGQFDRALPLYEETLRLRKAKLGPKHPDTLISMNNLAHCYMSVGKNDQALPLYEETLPLLKARRGPDHPESLKTMHNLAGAYKAVGQLDRALALYDGTLTLEKSKLGPDHPITLTTMKVLASAYLSAGKIDPALALLLEQDEHWKHKVGADSPRYLDALGSSATTLLQYEQWTAAETVLREIVTIRETKSPDGWATFNAKSRLGGALLGQKKYAAAEPLLRAGYEGMKQRAEQIPGQSRHFLSEALDRLISLADATNKPNEARMWQDERARLAAASAPKPEAENP